MVTIARRRLLAAVAGAAAAWPVAAGAQQAALPVIGFLINVLPEGFRERLSGFRQGLRDGGYVEGKNVAIEYRWAENQNDRLPSLAAELARRRVAVMVAGGPPASLAAKAEASTFSVVFVVGDDPVRLGLVASLSHPGGNMTGISTFNLEITAKRMELLRELLPKAARIAVLINPADVAATHAQLGGIEAAARAMGLQIQIFNADSSAEIDAAFETIGRERPDAVFVAVTPFFNSRRVQLVQLAAFHRMPAAYGLRDYAEAGGLMSYGSNIVDAYREVGIYVGRILKGSRPADLPVIQATKFELIINAETARMLGLTVPPTLLATADEVIE